MQEPCLACCRLRKNTSLTKHKRCYSKAGPINVDFIGINARVTNISSISTHFDHKINFSFPKKRILRKYYGNRPPIFLPSGSMSQIYNQQTLICVPYMLQTTAASINDHQKRRRIANEPNSSQKRIVPSLKALKNLHSLLSTNITLKSKQRNQPNSSQQSHHQQHRHYTKIWSLKKVNSLNMSGGSTVELTKFTLYKASLVAL